MNTKFNHLYLVKDYLIVLFSGATEQVQVLYRFKVTLSTFLCKIQLCRAWRIQTRTDKPRRPQDAERELLTPPSWQTSSRGSSHPKHQRVPCGSAPPAFSSAGLADRWALSLPPLPPPHERHPGVNHHRRRGEGGRPSQRVSFLGAGKFSTCLEWAHHFQ